MSEHEHESILARQGIRLEGETLRLWVSTPKGPIDLLTDGDPVTLEDAGAVMERITEHRGLSVERVREIVGMIRRHDGGALARAMYGGDVPDFATVEVVGDWMGAIYRRLWKRGGAEGEGSLVTCHQLAILSGQNVSTVRGRIHRARKLGLLKRWEKQGGTVLIDRQEGLKLAGVKGKHLKKIASRD